MAVLSAIDLQALAADPRPPSPFATVPYVLVDAHAAEAFDDRRVLSWLAQLPVPTIAIGATASPLAQACDVHLAQIADVVPFDRSIRAQPLAAATLVQTLRIGARLPADESLVVESLAYAALQQGAEFHRWKVGFQRPPAAPQESGPAVDIRRIEGDLIVTLNRPANRNAMTVEMRDGLYEALALAVADNSIGHVHLQARGKCFSTGGDLREFGTAPDPATAHAIRRLTLPGRLLMQLAGKATVHVQGACIGSGIEFPAFAGSLTASPGSWFQLPELRYGLIPGAGGTVSIARRIGRQRAAWMALTGARVDCATALRWGLIDAVGP